MAMSMRSQGGLAAFTNSNRIGIRPVYDDFKPPVELNEDLQAHIVYIHLPGFLKEQIQIVADQSSRGLLRVRGERLVSANTWSRFLEEVVVPENCDITKTHAKFKGGVLRITMPQRILVVVSQSPPTSDEASTPERSPPQPPRPSPLPHPTSLHPVASPQTAPRLVPPSSQPPPHTRPNVLPQPQTTTTTQRLNDLPPQQTHMTGLAAEANPPLNMSEPRFTPSIQPKPREDANPSQDLPHQDLATQKDPIASERWRGESNTPMPPRKSITRDSPMIVPTENEKHKKAIQGMSIRRLNDDRQLLVNMGVAVMVIVALGAWISYSFGSFEKSDN